MFPFPAGVMTQMATLSPATVGGTGAYAFSNGNLSATRTDAGSSVAAVRSPSGRSAGKFYFEAKIVGGLDGGWGVIQTNQAFGAVPGVDSGMVALAKLDQWTGNVFVNSATASGTIIGSGGPHIASGDWVGVAVDLDNKKIWFRSAGHTSWNNNGAANPGTNTGGLDISGMTFPLQPWFETYAAASAITANFGQSAYAMTVPSGFGNWPF